MEGHVKICKHFTVNYSSIKLDKLWFMQCFRVEGCNNRNFSFNRAQSSNTTWKFQEVYWCWVQHEEIHSSDLIMTPALPLHIAGQPKHQKELPIRHWQILIQISYLKHHSYSSCCRSYWRHCQCPDHLDLLGWFQRDKVPTVDEKLNSLEASRSETYLK